MGVAPVQEAHGENLSVTQGLLSVPETATPKGGRATGATDRTPHSAFTMGVDYLAWTFPSACVQEVIKTLGGRWEQCSGGQRGYRDKWITDDSRGRGYIYTGAMRNPREVHAELSGGVVAAWPAETTQSILAWVKVKRGHLTRLDVALDDRHASVSLDMVRQAKRAGQIVTKIRTYRETDSRNMATDELQGATIYIGTRQSGTQLRIYNKRLELKQKGRADWERYGIRWEIQLRDERAQALAEQFRETPTEDWKRLAVGALRSVVDFRAVTRATPKWGRSRGKLLPWWETLTEGFATARLRVSAPTDGGLHARLKWLEQIAPMLSVILDLPGGRDLFEDAIWRGRAHRKPKHLAMLREYVGIRVDMDAEQETAEPPPLVAV